MRISDWSSDVCSSDLFLMTDPATRFGVESSRPTPRHGKCALDVLRRLQPRQIDVACALGRWVNNHGLSIRRWLRQLSLLDRQRQDVLGRSEEHTSELQSLMRISYAVFCLKKKTHKYKSQSTNTIVY